MADTLDIMGVALSPATAAEAIATLDDRLEAGERIKLAFLNAHGSNLAAGNGEFLGVLRQFTVLNDGAGLNIASRVLHGRPFPENLNGTDFTPLYLAETRHVFRVFLLGAEPGIADAAAAALAKRALRHAIVGTRDGFFQAAEGDSVARAIAATGADLVLVAMGNPAQEIFIARHFDAMGCRLAIGVGALFDFLAGRVPRAPRALRALGIEWIYRLGLEPGRMWRRYVLGNPKFLWRVARARLRRPPVKMNKTPPMP